MHTPVFEITQWQVVWRLLLLAISAPVLSAQAETDDVSHHYLDFVRYQASLLRANDTPPPTLAEWKGRREILRSQLLRSWGGFPAHPCPLQAKKCGELARDGYRVEKIIFQTRPGVWMTSDAYIPDGTGKFPAVLAVHGHWPGAKQDPVVQARCIGLVKLGFFVLAVDAFGAGERGIRKALGEYHGEMIGATLLPVGLPLSGLQVYENMRAVDYILSRPEVDGARIGVTGASGGGNQTMYAGGWDARLSAVVPVCSVGNYQAYLGTGCCMCEVIPGALRFTEEWGVLGLSAPRALLVINATKDSIQFSVGEANKSVAAAQHVFGLYGSPEKLEHAVFESPHAYSRPMRETMYGWMAQYLKGDGDGSLILEPDIKTEDPEELRCFLGNSRPDDFVTIPKFAAGEARKLLQRIAEPKDKSEWARQRDSICRRLSLCLLGGDDAPPPGGLLISQVQGVTGRTLTFEPEPHIRLTARVDSAVGRAPKYAVLLDLDGEGKALAGDLPTALRGAGWSLVTLDLRATGQLAWPYDRIERAPDHNSAEWGLWLGRPLLGQWLVDLHGLLDALTTANGGLPENIALVGVGTAGPVAICAAALDPRVTAVAAVGSLASYVTEVPYENQRLGLMAPGILREAGDIPQLAALLGPRRLIVAGAVMGGGQELDSAGLGENFGFTRRIYALEEAEARLTISTTTSGGEVARLLR